jgi:UDP-N-acetylmuramoyl-L-alanyl-D-glutamate--2,6-diaminopimelate ligase
VIVTDDNPRSEDPERIVRDIMAGMQKLEAIAVVRDRRAAITQALADATVGDIVLIAGKGHENYQLIGAERLPFSDCAVVHERLFSNRRDNILDE